MATDGEDLKETYIYHITTRERWHEAGENGSYAAPSLESEGFIHCSRRDQVERSLNKFFREHEHVLLLTIDPELLTSELRTEPAGDDTFPHIYGELNIDSVIGVELLERGEEGTYSL